MAMCVENQGKIGECYPVAAQGRGNDCSVFGASAIDKNGSFPFDQEDIATAQGDRDQHGGPFLSALSSVVGCSLRTADQLTGWIVRAVSFVGRCRRSSESWNIADIKRSRDGCHPNGGEVTLWRCKKLLSFPGADRWL